MPENGKETEIYRLRGYAQQKYDYFLMAVAGAAIAFAVQRTTGKTIAWNMIPLALAVINWGVSFFAGCRRQEYVLSTMYANMELLRVQKGLHPEIGQNPQLIEAATSGIRDACEFNSNRGANWAKTQFRCLIAGAVLFIVWHVIDMVAGTG